MVTSSDCIKKFGIPTKNMTCLTYWYVPKSLQINNFPKLLWCNKAIIDPLKQAMTNLINRGHIDELCTFDGCFNIRPIRGQTNGYSLHSWAIAIDVNAATNQLNTNGDMSAGFVKCFTDAGFDWGGNFKSRKDPMHFQLSKI